MNRFIAIHPDRCIGCGTCQAACSEGHFGVGMQGEPRLSVVTTRDVSAAVTCHHCEGAPCLQVCPVNAIYCQEGAVIVSEQRCIGCKLCAVTCPFGAIHPSGTSVAGAAGIMVKTPTFPASLDPMLQWEIGVYTCAVKCDLCESNEAGPRCVDACLTEALEYVATHDIVQSSETKRVRAAGENRAMSLEIAAIRRTR